MDNLAKSSFGESQKCTYLYSTSPLMPTTSLPEKMHISCILYRCSIYFCSPFFQVFKDVKPLLFGPHPPSLSISILKKTWHPPVKGSNKVHVQDHSCHGRMDVWICLENSIIIIVVFVIAIF